MKSIRLGIVLLGLTSMGCTTSELLVDQTYIQADRATYDLIAPIITTLADDDPDNDPDLTGVNGTALLQHLEVWDKRITTREELLAAGGQ